MALGISLAQTLRTATIVVLAGLSLAVCGTKETPVQPSPLNLSIALDAASLIGGSSTSGTVTLSPPAGATGVQLTLSSSGAAATVPATLTIPAGGATGSFTVSTSQVPTATEVRISAATTGGTPVSATLGVRPIPTCGPFVTTQVAVPFSVYVDDGDDRNHFIPSGFFGDTGDLTINTNDRTAPHGGASSIRIDYRPRGTQRFAGIFWQCPENNWGTTPGAGFDLTRARQVVFWARTSAPARVEFKVGGIGTSPPVAPFPDSFASASTVPTVVDLGTDWRQFTIDLGGRNLQRVIGGFMFVTNTAQNPQGVTLFLDDIVWQ